MPQFALKAGWYAKAALLTAENFLGVTVVIAPHPDDESLGCGGTIALLKQAGRKVNILFVSDGSMSHPNSKKYPPHLLAKLRQREALFAARMLGVPESDCMFMALKDSMVPTSGERGFDKAVKKMAELLKNLSVQNIILPWKNDPHQDHQASWQIVNAAILSGSLKVRLFHYLVWFWERGDEADEELQKAAWWKVDVGAVSAIKLSAIAAHQSQVTALIDDDPTGFILSPEVLAHFDDTFELFATIKN